MIKIKAGNWTLTGYGKYAILSDGNNPPEQITVGQAQARIERSGIEFWYLGELQPEPVESPEAPELELLLAWLRQIEEPK